MKRTAWLRTLMLLLACLGLLVPSPVVAAVSGPAQAAPQARAPIAKTLDVELQQGGALVGQVVDAQGTPQVGVPVTLLKGNNVLVNTTSNDRGHFAMNGVFPGTYRIIAGGTQTVHRVWATGTAPPTARPGSLLVVDQGLIRGQTGPIGYWLGNPWVIAGLVCAAVAIPVAIHNHQIDHDDAPISP